MSKGHLNETAGGDTRDIQKAVVIAAQHRKSLFSQILHGNGETITDNHAGDARTRHGHKLIVNDTDGNTGGFGQHQVHLQIVHGNSSKTVHGKVRMIGHHLHGADSNLFKTEGALTSSSHVAHAPVLVHVNPGPFNGRTVGAHHLAADGGGAHGKIW
ncbi:MAG: hypothetical protein BWX80_02928 [Candidatus Hydrogenedentes bacterium ADurb.Bin101]|nr:MAG: hypothetical protein BWX80_02928 [Candidatus Hydrogenedentes bacterium ADurb.Bin101]